MANKKNTSKKKKMGYESEIDNLNPEYIEELIDPEELQSASQLSEDEKDHEILNKLVSSFASSEGFYGKLYRKTPFGKLEFKYILDTLEEISDAELEILNLIKEKGWKDGDYVLRIFKRGHPDCKKTLSWTINVDPETNTSNGSNGNKDISLEQKLSEISNIMSMLNNIRGNDNVPSQEHLAKIISDTFKNGVETVKTSKDSESIEKTFSFFKNLGLIKDNSDDQGSLLKTITVLKELGLIGKQEKKDDFWTEFSKLKELGLIQTSNENKEDTFSQIEKVKNLMSLMGEFAGTAEKPTLGVKLVEIVGPQLPQIIQNISSTVNNIAEFSKMKMMQKMNVSTQKKIQYQNHPERKPEKSPESTLSNDSLDPYNNNDELNISEIDKQPSASSETNIYNEAQSHQSLERNTPMNPLVREIYDAVQQDNQEYYPRLKELIYLYLGGDNALNQIIDNQVTIAGFLDSVSKFLNESFFIDQKTQDYFRGFMLWYTEEITKNMISAKCDSCGEVYDYESSESFDNDSKICECGGKMVKIETMQEGTA